MHVFVLGSTAPVIIAGAAEYAYDSDTLLQLDKSLLQTKAENVIWNFHPYHFRLSGSGLVCTLCESLRFCLPQFHERRS
jgi:hypothetical protein